MRIIGLFHFLHWGNQMNRKLLRQALDALTLECRDSDGNPVDLKQIAVEALEAELAKPETPEDLLRQSEIEGWRT